MKSKSKHKNKLYRQVAVAVTSVFLIKILLFLSILLLIFKAKIFEGNFFSNNLLLTVICFIVSLLIVSMGITVITNKIMVKPIAATTEVINNVAQGNFDVEIDTSNFRGEIKNMADDINIMIGELRSMEVMREDFVSNISHEFKAPLSAIQGYVTLISNPAISSRQKEEYFELLTQSTRQLSDLVENVLKLSRLDSQNIVQQSEKFRLDEQLRRTIIMYEKQWSEKNLELELDLPECEYTGNEKMLNQIWINLIGNSVKFTNNGDKIRIRIDNNSPDIIKVTVSDTGEGMTEEVQKHIFERFYQGDTSRKSQGNGVGLSIVKKIADLTDCEIEVESEFGIGSTFTVTLKR